MLVLGPALAGLVCGLLAAPSRRAGYLALQAVSDDRHRLAVAVLPACVLAALIAWGGLRAAGHRRWARGVARGLLAAAWAVGCGMLVFIVQFDRRIEAQGLRGQLVIDRPGPPAAVAAPVPAPVQGPVFEGAAGPGIALDLADGEVITLDRRRLARRTAGGSFRWSRKRPGGHPAALLARGDVLLFAGPGTVFEDDCLVAAIDLDRGTRRWSYHFLGRRVLPAPAGDGALALAAVRPSGTTVRLLALRPPAPLWITRLDEQVSIPPRARAGWIEVAAGAEIVALDRTDGRVTGRRRVCPAGHGPEVTCRDGRVVGWGRDVPR